MPRYLMLRTPSANRVYAGESGPLTVAELEITAPFAREVSDRVAFFHKGVMAEICPPEALFGASKDADLQTFLAATH